jgi:hypothetical protein
MWLYELYANMDKPIERMKFGTAGMLGGTSGAKQLMPKADTEASAANEATNNDDIPF